MNDDYVTNEDSITLTELSDTCSETIYCLIKATLEVNSLPLSLCRGQMYDRAAVMKVIRNGVSKKVRNDCPQALPVHCLAHSLNLCLQLQDAVLRNNIDLVREISQLINFSPKRKHLFADKVFENDGPSV